MPAVGFAADEEPIARVSEELLTAGEAWEEPGFRIQLRAGTENVEGSGGAPSGSGLSLSAEPGMRLNRWWSITANLTYTVVTGEMRGLRWSGTADLSLHPAGGLFLSAGAGYGGLMVNSFGGSCTGMGLALGTKAGWLFPMGTLFSTGPVVGMQWQRVRCPKAIVDDFDLAAPSDDGPAEGSAERPDVLLRHRTLYLGWSLAWR